MVFKIFKGSYSCRVQFGNKKIEVISKDVNKMLQFGNQITKSKDKEIESFLSVLSFTDKIYL